MLSPLQSTTYFMKSPLQTKRLAIVILLATGAGLLGWLGSNLPAPWQLTRSVNFRPASAPGAQAPARLEPSPIEVTPQKPPAFLSRDLILAHELTRELHRWENNDDPALRGVRIHEVEALLRHADPRAILSRLPPDLINFALGLPPFQRWITTQPAAAAQWMSPHAPIAEARVTTLVQAWLQSDPDEVSQYLASLAPSPWRQQLLAEAGREAVADHPDEALTWAGKMTPGPARTGLLEAAVRNLAASDPQNALQWINAQNNDPVLHDQLSGQFANGRAAADPVAALQFASDHIDSPQVLAQTVDSIASLWAARDPQATATWIAQMPVSDARRAALGSLINTWANSDRPAALAWTTNLAPGPLQERASELLTALPFTAKN